MENKVESGMETGEETGNNFLELFLYRVPKKNHDAVVQNQKQFLPWFKKHGVRAEFYQLGESETQAAVDSARESGMDVMESLAKPPSTAAGAAQDDEGEKDELWIEQQYFRDYKHCEDVYSKMMQDKSIEPIGTEFFGLITQGKKMITGGFHRLSG